MCKALCPSRCPWGAHHAALLIAGLWPSLALHWPAASVCGFDFFLSDSQQRAIAHWRLQQEHALPLGSDFPLEQYSLSRQPACEKSGVGGLEEAAWQLNSPLRTGSLFPGGQDIVCLGQIFFFLLGGKRQRCK